MNSVSCDEQCYVIMVRENGQVLLDGLYHILRLFDCSINFSHFPIGKHVFSGKQDIFVGGGHFRFKIFQTLSVLTILQCKCLFFILTSLKCGGQTEDGNKTFQVENVSIWCRHSKYDMPSLVVHDGCMRLFAALIITAHG